MIRKMLFAALCFLAAAGGAPARAADSASSKKPSPAEIEKIKADNARALEENGLITEYQTLAAAKKWDEAAKVQERLIELNPKRWAYREALADCDLNLGRYEDAVAAYETALALVRASKAREDAGAKGRAAAGRMLTNEGNAYLKLKKSEQAMAAYSSAARLSPDPGTAYFNLCATAYNAGDVKMASSACDKAIAANPKKADAYFIKGSVLFADSTAGDGGKLKAPAESVRALKKYLELSPDGPHAGDVKEMLKAVGEQ